ETKGPQRVVYPLVLLRPTLRGDQVIDLLQRSQASAVLTIWGRVIGDKNCLRIVVCRIRRSSCEDKLMGGHGGPLVGLEHVVCPSELLRNRDVGENIGRVDIRIQTLKWAAGGGKSVHPALITRRV